MHTAAKLAASLRGTKTNILLHLCQKKQNIVQFLSSFLCSLLTNVLSLKLADSCYIIFPGIQRISIYKVLYRKNNLILCFRIRLEISFRKGQPLKAKLIINILTECETSDWVHFNTVIPKL